MAGGTWSTQNKVRPGVYIRFKSTEGLTIQVGERGVVAICEPLSWGPEASVMTVEAGADVTPFTGYDISDPKNLFLREIFKGTDRTSAPRQVLLYRPTASSSAKAEVTAGTLTATAKYPGARGNDISITITALTEPEDAFLVSTIVAGSVVDSQTAAAADDLVSNDWVDFSGTGALTASAGSPLTGGADGTVQSAAYSAFLSAIEPYQFDVLVYDGTDETVQSAMVSFIQRIAEEDGVYAQLVASGLTDQDSRYVINVASGAVLSDGTTLTPGQVTWWVGGATAGALYNQDLTHASYPGAVDVTPKLTNSGYEQAIQSGQFVLLAEDGEVKVEYDIDSLVETSQDIGPIFRYNRVMRLCNTVARDIGAEFSRSFIGVVNNNEAGRSQFKAAVVGYLLEIQAGQGIQNFTADDVTVSAGEAIDAVVVNVALQAVGSANKIYMTIQVS